MSISLDDLLAVSAGEETKARPIDEPGPWSFDWGTVGKMETAAVQVDENFVEDDADDDDPFPPPAKKPKPVIEDPFA